MPRDVYTLTCSFCGNTTRDVKHIIVGPTVSICDGCICLSVTILREEGFPLVPLVTPEEANLPLKDILKGHPDITTVGELLLSLTDPEKLINKKIGDLMTRQEDVEREIARSREALTAINSEMAELHNKLKTINPKST